MKRQVYEIDSNGFILEIYVADFDEEGNPIEELANNIITRNPPHGLYRAKWTGETWIEDMSQEEIGVLNNVPQPATTEEQLAEKDRQILELKTKQILTEEMVEYNSLQQQGLLELLIDMGVI